MIHMITDKKLNANGRQLSIQLAEIKAAKVTENIGQLINVAGVGKEVSVAYEQLRNAAEYTQEHLLIQKAIRRFYVRNLSFQNTTVVDKVIAEELITELIQSGYIQNDTLPLEMIDKMKTVVQKHYGNYWRLKDHGVIGRKAIDWTLDLLSVESEKLIAEEKVQTIYIQFAYRHYQSILQKKSFVSDKSDGSSFEASLYVSVHKALFKSDIAGIRYDMQQLYDVSDTHVNAYARFHENIDDIFSSALTEKITRYINTYGAPLRILKSMVQDNDGVSELLLDSGRFHTAYAAQVNREYHKARTKLNKGVIKSIAFLLITKTVIGVAVEVPYDLLTTGIIMIIPLTINLFAPAVYIGLLRLGLKLPGEANTKAMQLYADNMLYGDQDQADLYPAVTKNNYPVGFTFAYIMISLMAFGLVTKLLVDWRFNIVQGATFFVFFATASFLGFRLSRIVREIELVTENSGIIMTIRDFIYMPFILLGQWLSEQYSKVNIVALILDTIIELPLKTVLRLIRQWSKFIDDKKNQI